MGISLKTRKKLNILKLLSLKLKFLQLNQLKNEEKKAKKTKKKKRFWMRNFLKERKLHGAFHQLIPQLRALNTNEDVPETFLNYLRMTPECFDALVEQVRPLLTKQWINREPISVEEQLAVTLRYLASGNSMNSIAYEFRIGFSTVSHIIKRATTALWLVLKDEVFPQTYTPEYWTSISKSFEEMWNFPNCIGALDGKHVLIQAFPKKGSSNFNYKKQHSVVLMAICDAQYKFVYVDVGAAGRHSDGGIFKSSKFGSMLANNPQYLNLPPESPLSNSNRECPYVIVGDEAFPLLKNLMRPYPGRGGDERMERNKAVYNYRLSRCRRTIENAFGVYSSRFRIFRKPIHASQDTVNAIVQCTVVLHNYLIMNYRQSYILPGALDTESHLGNWRRETQRDTGLLSFSGSSQTNTPTLDGSAVRNILTEYFANEGAVSWQMQHVHNVM